MLGTLTRQVAEAEVAGRSEALLRTGNADSARDFTDVRDVVRAYVEAATLAPDAYNVCSETAVTVNDLMELVSQAATIPVVHEIDPARSARARRARDPRLGGPAAHAHGLESAHPARADRGGRLGRMA